MGKNLSKYPMLASGIFFTAFLIMVGYNYRSELNYGVWIIKGPTPIPGGEAVAAGDLTLKNDFIAISIAMDTAPPWGVARGSIIDAALVKEGVISHDLVSLADFIPNNWSNWPSSYHDYKIIKQSRDEAVILVRKDWQDVRIETTYSLKADDNRIHLSTTMINTGENNYRDLLSGYVLWPKDGYLFEIPGLANKLRGESEGALTDWMAAYDKDWSMGMHAPYANFIDFHSKDLYLKHDLGPYESRSFEAWLQFNPSSDFSPMLDFESQRKGKTTAKIFGTVVDTDGNLLDQAAIIVKKNGSNYIWTMSKYGFYSINLPLGDYQVYAAAKNYSNSAPVQLKLSYKHSEQINFANLAAPGQLKINVIDKTKQQAKDARITIENGQTPVVAFFGDKTFFTELEQVGSALINLAPGHYRLKISSGENFFSKGAFYELNIKSREQTNLTALVESKSWPNKQAWYSADLHHHSDVLDGRTQPELVVRSQLAAGLDVLFISDHDSSKNHQKMFEFSQIRQVPFLASMEISPSWGHFNVFPLSNSALLGIDLSSSSFAEIIQEVKRMGGTTIQVNHPYISYGYFFNVERNKITKSPKEDFNLIEINSNNQETQQQTIEKAWDLWNHGLRYYLSAGTDTHNVWHELSGEIRSFAYVKDNLSADGFSNALRAGHSYVSYGPLIFPDIIFGEELALLNQQELKLNFKLQSVNGLKSVQLIKEGQVIETAELGGLTEISKSFKIIFKNKTWYSLIVEDNLGKKAFSNPIWLRE